MTNTEESLPLSFGEAVEESFGTDKKVKKYRLLEKTLTGFYGEGVKGSISNYNGGKPIDLYPKVNIHGGRCCGIKNIYGFDVLVAELTELVFDHIMDTLEELDKGGDRGILFQITLTGRQKRVFGELLFSRGFEMLPKSFINRNTGNRIYSYERLINV